MTNNVPTLLEWCGGPSAVRRLIDAFYDRVESDDLLSPLFPGGVGEAHRHNVSLWWVEVLGGPSAYTASSGATRGCWPTTGTSPSRRSSGFASPR